MGDAQQAEADYNQAVTLLQTPIGKADADPTESPTALLGRARANKSLAVTAASTANTVDKSQTFASFMQHTSWCSFHFCGKKQ
jgi:hypothetical protein